MRTTKELNDMLKKGFITENVLGQVLYSIIKRSQKWREQKIKYKDSYYIANYAKACESEREYHLMKEYILSEYTVTEIEDIKNDRLLLSAQFCKKVHSLLKENKIEILRG